MKILAFDSTAKVASVALTSDGRLLSCYSIDNGLTQSELLLPMCEDMLSSLRLGFDDIDCYAVTVGPGSFTGVRIGVSLVKGLAFGRNLPIVEVSTLEALCENLRGLDGLIVPVMDARRSQTYTAIFRCEGGEITRLTEDSAISVSELCDRLGEYPDEPIYTVGDGYEVYRPILSERLGERLKITPSLITLQNAASVARVAYRKLLNNERTTDRELSPLYLRMPQAERERLERLGNK